VVIYHISHNEQRVREVRREASGAQRLISIWGVLLPQIDYHSLVEAKHRGEFGRGAKGYRPVAANTLVMRLPLWVGGGLGVVHVRCNRHGGRGKWKQGMKGGVVSRRGNAAELAEHRTTVLS